MGRIHSIETLGLVDGPGIRFVVFFQGCRLRCAYCHNPDTWDFNKGEEIEAKKLFEKALRYQPYFTRSGGGITCSGGEPLMQPQFLIDFLRLCKEHNIHTAIDTAGFGQGNYEQILKYTDLVILDLKHVNKKGYLELTGGNIEEFKLFKKAVNKSQVKLWLRHVIIPGLTDNKKHLLKLKEVIKSFNNVEKIELLPYHVLGVNKYKELGIKYKLAGIKPMDKNKLRELEKFLMIA